METCHFCTFPINSGRGAVSLSACRHTFCRACLESYLLNAVELAPATVPCMADGCNGIITDAEMASILSPTAYKTYVWNLRRKQQNGIIQCRNNSCKCNLAGSSRKSLDEEELSRNMEEGCCQLCHKKFDKLEDAVMLQSCSHLFCRACLSSSIKNSRNATINCPIRNQRCAGILDEAEVKALVEPSFYNAYLKRSIDQVRNRMSNVFNCKTRGCDGWCEIERGTRSFLCQLCDKVNCIPCQSIHEGLSCDVYQRLRNPGELTALQRTNGFMQISMKLQASKEVGEWPELALSQLLEESLLTNSMSFECPICFTNVEVGDGIILKECLHMYCKECLVMLVETAEEPLVKCPFIDGNYSCVCFLQEREIKALVPQNTFEKHLARSIRQGENACPNSFHCLTPDCTGWCVAENRSIIFKCYKCGRDNCIKCEVQHLTESCEEYRAQREGAENQKASLLSEQEIEKLIKEGKYMRCPTCSIPLEKISGCSFVRCLSCKTAINWNRKRKWEARTDGTPHF